MFFVFLCISGLSTHGWDGSQTPTSTNLWKTIIRYGAQYMPGWGKKWNGEQRMIRSHIPGLREWNMSTTYWEPDSNHTKNQREKWPNGLNSARLWALVGIGPSCRPHEHCFSQFWQKQNLGCCARTAAFTSCGIQTILLVRLTLSSRHCGFHECGTVGEYIRVPDQWWHYPTTRAWQHVIVFLQSLV